MNRRGFLGALIGAIGGLTLDRERLPWVPGKKLISIPSPRITRLSRYKVGDTVVVRVPMKFMPTPGPYFLNPFEIMESFEYLTLRNQAMLDQFNKNYGRDL